MKNINRFMILLLLPLLMCGCTVRNKSYYDHIAETAISFYRTKDYDTKGIDGDDLIALDNFLAEITHEGQNIKVNDFFTGDSSPEVNSALLWTVGDECFIKYEDLKYEFDEFYRIDPDSNMEATYTVTCNGKYATLYENNFYPEYEATLENPRYDYVLLATVKESNKYSYIYRSSYDASGLKLNLNLEGKKLVSITTESVNTYDYLN